MNIGVIDGSFPSKNPFGFRNREINGLLETDHTTKAIAASVMFPGEDAWFNHSYGMSKEDFAERKAKYVEYYPENRLQVTYLKNQYDEPFLALTYFLADTYTFLPFMEKNNLPFCFVLYPGGALGVNNPSSDAMLSRIFKSPQFRKVIVTSDITEKYLRDTGLCDTRKIESLWGGVSQFVTDNFIQKPRFPEDKDTIDILFVAFKYSDDGYDKGYDLYVRTAQKVLKKHKNVIFHVVGNFSKEDYGNTKPSENILFHGPLYGDELEDLYTKVDIQVSLSRSNVLYDGNFDGFPLGIDALFTNTLLITSDTLDQNGNRFSSKEFSTVNLEVDEIVSKLEYFIQKPNTMYKMAYAGTSKANALLDVNQRVIKLDRILKKEIIAMSKEASRG